MKVQLHTSPVTEAFLSQDECPFCHLEKDAQQRAIRFYAGAGASYMEPDIRGITNRLGFCSDHMKKLYDYGNILGAALMLQSHMESILLDLESLENKSDKAEKSGLFQKKVTGHTATAQHLQQRVESCAICNQVEDSMARYYEVFFSLLAEPEFRRYVEESKGFCLRHFARLLQEAERHLPGKHAQWFYLTVNSVMQENLLRVKKDLDLLIAKHDYRNASLDWGNAKDSVPRAMQKIAGIYPADPPYQKE